MRIDPSSGTTFLVDRRTGHSYPRTPLSRESDEDNIQAISSTRRTIAFADTGDRGGEPPQWIRDALKVGTAHVGLRLETYKCHERIIPPTWPVSDRYPPFLSDFQIFTPFLSSMFHPQHVPHTLVAAPTALSPPSSINHLHGALKKMISPA